MKAMIIGDANSIHIHNFIEIVFSNNERLELTIFNTSQNKNMNEDTQKYFKEKNINLISGNTLEELVNVKCFRAIPKVSTLIYRYKLSNRIKKSGKFDYCLIHFVDKLKASIILKNKKQFKNIITIFWGSDLLRNPKINKTIFMKLFNNSYKIIFNTEYMHERFKGNFELKYDYKSEVIKFPIHSFDEINKINESMTKEELFNKLNLPSNKNIIVCGHSAFKAEQHSELIRALSMCSDDTLNSCYFIFPMTYGEKNIKEQQEEVSNLMDKFELEGRVLTKYLMKKEMLEYMICADVFISVIKTDAFSAVLQENIYSGSTIIYGSWLKYHEFSKNKIYAKTVDDIDDITNTLENVIANIEIERMKCLKNKDVIFGISSPESIKSTWQKKVFLMY